MVETAALLERSIERLFPCMTERRMADVVGQAQRLGQVLVQSQRAGDDAADLRDFQAVRQADALMVAIGGHEDLRLPGKAAEGDRMDDPVAVALESAARSARTCSGLLEFTAPAGGGAAGIGGAGHGSRC